MLRHNAANEVFHIRSNVQTSSINAYLRFGTTCALILGMENNQNPSLETLAHQISELSVAVQKAIQARGPGLAKTKSDAPHPMEKLILDAARATGTVSLTEIAKKSGTSRANAWYHAKRLAAKGAIRLVSDDNTNNKRLSFCVALKERVTIQ